MKLFVPFEPLEKSANDECIVEGYASTEAIDSQNEVVTRKAMENALPDWLKFGNIREMHQPSAVGVAVSAEHDDKGLRLRAKVVDDNARKKVEAGVYKGFSIGGRVTNRDKTNKAIITGLHLTEISLVDRPANPEALFDVWKADGMSADDADMSKGMMAISLLAGVVDQVKHLAEHSKIEEAKENDTASVVPAELEQVLGQLSQILNDMVAEETAELLDGTDAEQPCAPEMIFMAEGTVDIEKRAYTPAERKNMASTGEALGDGSFPIRNRADLENAIKAYGRATDKAAAKTHIEKRAQELGATDLIPDGWSEKADEIGDLEKAGRRNSTSDQKKLNDAHDAIVAAGADCGAAKAEQASDLAKAKDDLSAVQADLSKAATQLAEAQTALSGVTKARDEATASLLALSKAHETATNDRDDLAKRTETLLAEKSALDEENAVLKSEVEKLKAVPEPLKGKLLAVEKGQDISVATVTPADKPVVSVAALPGTAPKPETWFTTR